jgi:hypothetical protein
VFDKAAINGIARLSGPLKLPNAASDEGLEFLAMPPRILLSRTFDLKAVEQ